MKFWSEEGTRFTEAQSSDSSWIRSCWIFLCICTLLGHKIHPDPRLPPLGFPRTAPRRRAGAPPARPASPAQPCPSRAGSWMDLCRDLSNGPSRGSSGSRGKKIFCNCNGGKSKGSRCIECTGAGEGATPSIASSGLGGWFETAKWFYFLFSIFYSTYCL